MSLVFFRHPSRVFTLDPYMYSYVSVMTNKIKHSSSSSIVFSLLRGTRLSIPLVSEKKKSVSRFYLKIRYYEMPRKRFGSSIARRRVWLHKTEKQSLKVHKFVWCSPLEVLRRTTRAHLKTCEARVRSCIYVHSYHLLHTNIYRVCKERMTSGRVS